MDIQDKHSTSPNGSPQSVQPLKAHSQDAARLMQMLDAPDGARLRFYRGRSMLGTFKPGDYLHIQPIKMDEARVGDVVAFRQAPTEEEGEVIVHRVFAIRPEGLVTWGDNNPFIDRSPVTAVNLVGRVTHFERDGKTYLTPPERARPGGRRWVRVLRYRLRQLFMALATPPYRLLRRSGAARWFWKPALLTLLLTDEQGVLIKYLYQGRSVGAYRPETDTWVLRVQPYDLVMRTPKKGW